METPTDYIAVIISVITFIIGIIGIRRVASKTEVGMLKADIADLKEENDDLKDKIRSITAMHEECEKMRLMQNERLIDILTQLNELRKKIPQI